MLGHFEQSGGKGKEEGGKREEREKFNTSNWMFHRFGKTSM